MRANGFTFFSGTTTFGDVALRANTASENAQFQTYLDHIFSVKDVSSFLSGISTLRPGLTPSFNFYVRAIPVNSEASPAEINAWAASHPNVTLDPTGSLYSPAGYRPAFSELGKPSQTVKACRASGTATSHRSRSLNAGFALALHAARATRPAVFPAAEFWSWSTPGLVGQRSIRTGGGEFVPNGRWDQRIDSRKQIWPSNSARTTSCGLLWTP